MLKFNKKFKKLQNYYFKIYWYKLLYFSSNKNIIFLSLNSFENIQVYLLKHFAINLNKFKLVALNYKILKSFWIFNNLDKKCINFLKSFNYILITDNDVLDYKKLKKINDLMLINNAEKLQYLNLMYVKLNTHGQLCSFNYLLNNLLKKYGKNNIFTYSLIIHLLNFNSIKLLKLLYLNTKIK